jgi:hypothetical protein
MLCSMGTCQCRMREETCVADTDCCAGSCRRGGDAGMGSGICECGRMAAACMTNANCCSGFECRAGRCQPLGCLAQGDRCGGADGGMAMGDAGMCCAGQLCSAQPSGYRTCCLPPPLVPGERPAPCATQDDCCGWSLCVGGNCRCQDQMQQCLTSSDCCGQMECRGGTCACQPEMFPCREGGRDCCPGTTCRNVTLGLGICMR